MMKDVYHQFLALRDYMAQAVIGQAYLVERLIITLLTGGHVLTEGAPGLAKTRAVKALANCLQASFKRIQFTPDLLPGDLIGTEIYHPHNGSFHFHQGPLFSNVILADELNRAPAKVQSALLEAMAEGQISVGSQTFQLPALFIVMATQNPFDQEGTYPLPEAQLDRFLLSIQMDYPSCSDEKKILQLTRAEASGRQVQPISPVITEEMILRARNCVLSLHMVPSIEDYIVRLIDATRHNTQNPGISKYLAGGVSSRATQALDFASRAHAWLKGRDFVAPEDVQSVAHDVLRHRLKLTFEAVSDGYTPNKIIQHLLNSVIVC